MKACYVLAGFLMFVFCAYSQTKDASSNEPSKYKIYTENYPPYNFTENGELKGICTEVVQEILKRLKMTIQITQTDWNNAYHTTLSDPNCIVYSMNLTDQRKPMFKWVGPLVSNEWTFFCKSDKSIFLKDIEDAKKFRIGTYFNDVCEDYLVDRNFKNVVCEKEDYKNISKLVNGKIDLWLTADRKATEYFAKQAGVDPTLIRPAYYVKSTYLYIAFNKKCPDELVQKFQSTLNEIKKDGTYDKIKEKYFSKKSPYNVSISTLVDNYELAKDDTAKQAPSQPAADPEKEKPSKPDVKDKKEKKVVVKQSFVSITITVPENHAEAMKKIATERGSTLDDVCSKALFNFIREDKKAKRKRDKVLKRVKKEKTTEKQKPADAE